MENKPEIREGFKLVLIHPILDLDIKVLLDRPHALSFYRAILKYENNQELDEKTKVKRIFDEAFKEFEEQKIPNFDLKNEDERYFLLYKENGGFISVRDQDINHIIDKMIEQHGEDVIYTCRFKFINAPVDADLLYPLVKHDTIRKSSDKTIQKERELMTIVDNKGNMKRGLYGYLYNILLPESKSIKGIRVDKSILNYFENGK